jgi:hypothetical protein
MATHTTDTGTRIDWHFDRNEVVRWDSNNRVPFDDVLVTLNLTPEQLKASQEAREIDNEAFFAEYRKAQKSKSKEQIAEERAEARAAHGRGVRITNIITGESFTT